MDADTIKAVADLAWPVLAAGIILALLPTIKAVARSRPFKIKFGDVELSVEDASQQLRKQIDDLQNQVRELTRPRRVSAAESVRAEPLEGTARPPSRFILWVDDKPDNNAYEIAKLQSDGFDVESVTSTQAALEFLRSRAERPATIISDMSRREGLLFRQTAGLELIREVRSMGLQIPIYVYASAAAASEYADEVRLVGGDGITASPLELFRMIEVSIPQSTN